MKLILITHFFIIMFFFAESLSCFQLGIKEKKIRIALFNIFELSTEKLRNVDENGIGKDPQVVATAKIIQKIRPDVLVVNEIDHDYRSIENSTTGFEGNALRFNRVYLNQGEEAISYPFIFSAPCNTGILTGLDLNGDGIVATSENEGARIYGEDCYGWGTYQGQYSMALFSKYPIDIEAVRTFQKYLWKDLPGHHMPKGYYPEKAVEILRLSSKSHWDVPITIKDQKIHLFLFHPTPPIFDGEEDRNGRRNFDEIKFWIHYIKNDKALYDDRGLHGGFKNENEFILIGDLNAFPSAKARYDDQTAIGQILGLPEVQDTGPFAISKGALMGRIPGPPNFFERNTVISEKFSHQIDYILPSSGLEVIDGGVFWPSGEEDQEGHQLAKIASDHRLVWIDVKL